MVFALERKLDQQREAARFNLELWGVVERSVMLCFEQQNLPNPYYKYTLDMSWPCGQLGRIESFHKCYAALVLQVHRTEMVKLMRQPRLQELVR